MFNSQLSGSKEETLIYSIYSFYGTKHSRHGQYLPINVMSWNSQWEETHALRGWIQNTTDSMP